jgi:spore coat protein U-like protein
MNKFLIAAGALSFAAAAGASTQTTTFAVTTNVLSSCTVGATDLTFPDYNPLSLTATEGSTNVAVRCSLLAPFNIGLNSGTQGGGTVITRKMKLATGADKLDYVLTRDLVHVLNWGETVLTDTLAGVGTGLSVNFPVYGQIAAGQNKSIGAYSDTITVTVTY